jgi:DNA end-binding protein Ku
MAPQALWSGNLRLSLVLIPVKLYPAVSTEGAVSFRMIHKPSGKPIRYVKGVETEKGFKEISEGEIIKGYEHAKGHHVLIKPEELDELKLEAKHTIDMVRFVDRADLDSRYFEKPYYLLPEGDEANEGYVIMRDALAKTGKVAIGQLIMQGREHLVGISAHGKGLVLEILRYAHELRDPEPYFDKLDETVKADAVTMAAELIERQSGRFEPQKMPNEYARAVQELVRAKVEHRAPEVAIETSIGDTPKVINIMAALKESMQSKGRAKVMDAVRKRMGKAAPKEEARSMQPRPRARPSRIENHVRSL